jgi:hypothetical protein
MGNNFRITFTTCIFDGLLNDVNCLDRALLSDSICSLS